MQRVGGYVLRSRIGLVTNDVLTNLIRFTTSCWSGDNSGTDRGGGGGKQSMNMSSGYPRP